MQVLRDVVRKLVLNRCGRQDLADGFEDEEVVLFEARRHVNVLHQPKSAGHNLLHIHVLVGPQMVKGPLRGMRHHLLRVAVKVNDDKPAPTRAEKAMNLPHCCPRVLQVVVYIADEHTVNRIGADGIVLPYAARS